MLQELKIKTQQKQSVIHKNSSTLSDQVLPRATDTRYKTFGYVAWNVIQRSKTPAITERLNKKVV